MRALRRLILIHRAAAAGLVAFALLMKLLVPTGYMPVVADGRFAVAPCAGYAPAKAHAAMPGMAHHSDDGTGDDRPEQPCAYAGLSAPSLGGADPLLLAAAIAFAAAAALRVAPRPAPTEFRHLRPPLRGPPTFA